MTAGEKAPHVCKPSCHNPCRMSEEPKVFTTRVMCFGLWAFTFGLWIGIIIGGWR